MEMKANQSGMSNRRNVQGYSVIGKPFFLKAWLSMYYILTGVVKLIIFIQKGKLLLIISIILTTISPFFIQDIPTETTKNTYIFQWGYPFTFVEQEIGINISHGEIDPEFLKRALQNPFVYQTKLLFLSYFASVLVVYLLLNFITFLLMKIKMKKL